MVMQTAMPIPTKVKTQKPWYKHVWPWLLMLGPFVVVVAGFHTAWIAFSQADALVVDDYYKQGKAINQDLSRDRVAASMKLDADLRYDAATGKLHGAVRSMEHALPGKLFISLVHSTQPAKDLKLEAMVDQQGNFSANLPMLDVARWQVVIEGERRDWRLNGTWAWPQQKNIELKADSPANG